MSKILFISAFPPNNKTAGQNYTRQLIEQLSKEYEIDIIYWNYPNHFPQIPSNVKILKELNLPKKRIVFFQLSSFFPFFSRRYSKNLCDYVSSIAGNYNYIYFDFSQVFLLSTKISHDHKIGMSHDVIAQKFERHSIFKIILPWIKYSEEKCLKSLNHILTFSKKDAQYLQEHYDIKSDIVSFFLEPNILKVNLEKINLKNYYVMYGAWNRQENQESIYWLLENHETIKKKVLIIGGGLPDNLLLKINDYSNFSYTGFVENPYPIIAASQGMLAPLFHGAGVKVKVIESLALGTPVVGTDISFEGIDQRGYAELEPLINLSKKNISESLKMLDMITIQDKKKIQQIFLSSYKSNSFNDLIKKGVL